MISMPGVRLLLKISILVVISTIILTTTSIKTRKTTPFIPLPNTIAEAIC